MFSPQSFGVEFQHGNSVRARAIPINPRRRPLAPVRQQCESQRRCGLGLIGFRLRVGFAVRLQHFVDVCAALGQLLFALAGQVRQLRAGAVGLGRGDGFLAEGGPALTLCAVFLKHLTGGLDAEVDVVAAGLMVQAPGHGDFIPHAVFAARLATFTAANVHVTGHV